jgi:hypothetical protein
MSASSNSHGMVIVFASVLFAAFFNVECRSENIRRFVEKGVVAFKGKLDEWFHKRPLKIACI